MFLSHNPADGSELCHHEAESWQSFLQKLHCLRIEQQSSFALSVTAHTALLSDLAARLETNRDKLTQMMCKETGRCLREHRAGLNKLVELIRYYARLAPELLTHKTIAIQANLSQVRFESLDMVLAMMPWNYPIWQILRFAVPALRVGNACAAKPVPSASRVMVALLDIIGSGLPVILAWLDEFDTLEAIEHTDVMVFTGPTFTGRLLTAHVGAHLKKSALELGGSNAFIAMSDADLAQAAKEACYLRLRDADQSCNAVRRIIVTQTVAEKFIPFLLAECVKLKTGNLLDADATLAPLRHADLHSRVREQVEDTLDNGTECLFGDTIPDGSGWFYPVTVLDHVNSNHRAYREEVFGPVATLLRTKDATYAVGLANDSPFGLGVCIYTADTAKAWRLAERIHAGSVLINRHTSSDLRLPFGGVKDSGYGRELSEFGLYKFVNVKTY